MPESISSGAGGSNYKPPKPDFNVISRDEKVMLERESKRIQASNDSKEQVERAQKSVESREKIRLTERERKEELMKNVVEKKTDDIQQKRKQEEQNNPKSGDIINVIA